MRMHLPIKQHLTSPQSADVARRFQWMGVHSHINDKNGRNFFVLLNWGAGRMVKRLNITCILCISSLVALKVQSV
jgi:hypothetical protein